MTQSESRGSVSSAQQSKAQAAREQTSAMGQKAMRAGGGVAQGAVAQGRETAAEGARQARDLVGQASQQVREQAGAQQKRAAQRLRTLGDEFQSMAGRDEQQGMASDLAKQASDRAHRAADWLEQREPGAVVEEVRDYARRHPGVFLAGAALVGMLAGRLTRNLAGGGGGEPGRGPADRTGMGQRADAEMPLPMTDGRRGPDGPMPAGYAGNEVGR